MITRIEASRYRCFEKMAADLSHYAVLVGANGAGKTTFLDIPSLIGDCLRQQNISQAFTEKQNQSPARCSTLRELIFCGQGNSFILAIEAALPEVVINALLPVQNNAVQKNASRWWRFIRYEIRLEIFNERQLQVKNEYCFLFSESIQPAREGSCLHGEINPHRDWRFIIRREYGGDVEFRAEAQKGAKSRSVKMEATRLALPKVQFEDKEDYVAMVWLYHLLVSETLFYTPDINKLKMAAPPGLPEILLMPNGQNLPWLALTLKQDTFRFDLWQDHVRIALPQMDTISVREREEDHHAYFVIRYRGGYEVTSSGLSEGTLKILALTILPYLNNLPHLVFLEEPENGIHPRAIEAVLQSLSSVYDSQLILSSHSPVVLANSDLEQILCTRLESNGAVSIIAGKQHPRLKAWQGQVDLGALFATGVLG